MNRVALLVLLAACGAAPAPVAPTAVGNTVELAPVEVAAPPDDHCDPEVARCLPTDGLIAFNGTWIPSATWRGKLVVVIGQRGTTTIQSDVVEAKFAKRFMDAVVLVVPLDTATSTHLLQVLRTQPGRDSFILLDPLPARGRLATWKQGTAIYDQTGTERLRSQDLPMQRWLELVRSHRRDEALF